MISRRSIRFKVKAFVSAILLLSVVFQWFGPGESSRAYGKEKKVKVWVINQKNRWGTYVICVNKEAIRINGSSGGVVLAKAPDWEVFVFHKGDRKYCKVPLSLWVRKTNGRLYLSNLKKKPKFHLENGLKVALYKFPINKVIDITAGTKTVYKTRSKSVFVKDTVLGFDANAKRLPMAPTIVWNGLYEFPNSNRAPIQSYYILKNDEKIYNLTTSSQTEKIVSASVFERPVGLAPTKRPILSVFMGTGLMDATEFLFDK